MKILFLDMDGVLNSEESFHLNHVARCEESFSRGENAPFAPQFCWPMGHIYPPLVERLNKIVDATDCQIVLSSSWRVMNSCTLENLGKWLTEKGFRYAHNLLDKTGQDDVNYRGGEIQTWLDEHHNVSAYVILDDDSFDIVGEKTNKKHPNNFVKTDFIWGLQDKQMEQAINILNVKL